jgi:hypothetical protein
MKVEVQLVWATDDSQPESKTNVPVQSEVRKKLKDLPLKWTKYYEISRKTLIVPIGGSLKEPISEKCAVEVKNLDGSNIEVGLFGKGAQVVRRTQKLPRGEILVFGGNAPNSTAWLVVLKRLD